MIEADKQSIFNLDQAVECSANLAGKLCYVVDSLILVEHHPSYYTRKSAETVVLPDAIDFVEDRGRYIGSSVRNENEDIKNAKCKIYIIGKTHSKSMLKYHINFATKCPRA